MRWQPIGDINGGARLEERRAAGERRNEDRGDRRSAMYAFDPAPLAPPVDDYMKSHGGWWRSGMPPFTQ